MNVFIYGSGATARLIARFAPYICAVVQDYPSQHPSTSPLRDMPVYSPADMLEKLDPAKHRMLIGIGYQHGLGGMNARREELANIGYALESAMFGVGYREGVAAGCIILPGTVLHDSCVVERNCFVASNVTIGHDVQVGEHSWINSGVSLDGSARVGRRCVIGANAVICAGVTLGDRTLVLPGAVVTRDTKPGSVVCGQEGWTHRFSSAVFAMFNGR